MSTTITIRQDKHHYWHADVVTGKSLVVAAESLETYVRKYPDGEEYTYPRYPSGFIVREACVEWAANKFPGVPQTVKPLVRRVVASLPFCKITAGREATHPNETNDCTVVALAQSTGWPYAKCHDAARKAGREDREGFYPEGMLRLLSAQSEYSFKQVVYPLPRYVGGAQQRIITLKDFVQKFPVGTFYVCNRNHAFTVYDGMIFDYRGRPGRERVLEAWKVEKTS